MELKNYIRVGCELENKFKVMEKRTESRVEIRKGRYLCIRIDGIGLSKKYLKNKIEEDVFDQLIKKATVATYERLKMKAPRCTKNIFLCAFACSDEVSVFFNNLPNDYEGRLFKITTTVASTFSAMFTRAAMQMNLKNNLNENHTFDAESFDGRPIEFKNLDQIYHYLFHRYATYIRNTATKVLRIKGVSPTELYSSDNYNNIEYIWDKLFSTNQSDSINTIQKHPRLFVPNSSNHFKEHRFETIENFIRVAPELISEYEGRLKQQDTRIYQFALSH